MRAFSCGSWCFVTVLKFITFWFRVWHVSWQNLKISHETSTQKLHPSISSSSLHGHRSCFLFLLCHLSISLSFFLSISVMKALTLGWEMSARCRLALLQSACQWCPQKPCGSGYMCGEVKEKKCLSFLFSSNEMFSTWPLLTLKLIPASCPFIFGCGHTWPRLSKPISRCCHGSALPAVGIESMARRQIEWAQTSRSFCEDCERQITGGMETRLWPVYSGASYTDARSLKMFRDRLRLQFQVDFKKSSSLNEFKLLMGAIYMCFCNTVHYTVYLIWLFYWQEL